MLHVMYGRRDYASRADTEAGGLIAYGVDPVETYKRAAGYVDRILKGARPGELRVQQPTKLELGVNLKTATARPRHQGPPSHSRPGRPGDRVMDEGPW